MTRIAIIGGGLAGLTSAYLLQKKSGNLFEFEIELFEATPRCGGRVFSKIPFDNNLVAEMGAISFCDNEKAILELVQELNLSIIERNDRQKKRYFNNGHILPSEKVPDTALISKFIFDNLKIFIETAQIKQVEDWYTINDSNALLLSEMDNTTIVAFIHNAIHARQLVLANPSQFKKSLSATLLGQYSGNLEALSTFEAYRFLNQYLETKKLYSIEGGNEQLIKALYQAVVSKVKIHHETPVKSIHKRPNGILQVNLIDDIEEPSKDNLFDYVIVAVPLTQLQSQNPRAILFSPPLAPQKQEALNAITSNMTVQRVYYPMKERFWLKDNPSTAMVITNDDTLWIEDQTAYVEAKEAILEAHIGGNLSSRVSSPSSLLQTYLSPVYPEFEEALDKSKVPFTFLWSKEPYQQGAFPSLKIHQKNYLAELVRNDAKLYFAGEYTAIDCPASMNGAVLSAHRTIEDILKGLKPLHKAAFTINPP